MGNSLVLVQIALNQIEHISISEQLSFLEFGQRTIKFQKIGEQKLLHTEKVL